MVKNPPAVRETWVQSLGWKDPLEEGMATHSSILAWRIPWTNGEWYPLGIKEVMGFVVIKGVKRNHISGNTRNIFLLLDV